MQLTVKKPDTYYLSNMEIENIFIGEFMPDAPCDFVKVYLLTLMHAQNGSAITEAEIARELRLSQADVSAAWEYWQKAGLVEKKADEIAFLSIKETLYGNRNSKHTKRETEEYTAHTTAPSEKTRLVDQRSIQKMFDEIEHTTKTFLAGTQMETILGWIEELDAQPEVVSAAFKYCVEHGKNNIKYVEAVVKNWTIEGLRTPEDVETRLEEMDEKHYTYRRVMKALGFARNPSEEEKKIISSWTDELECSMDEILSACAKTSGIPNPNINYVNSVIRGRRKEQAGPAGASRNKVMEYYEQLRHRAEDEAAKRRKEIYAKEPRIKELDDEAVSINFDLTKTLMGGDRGAASRLSERLSELEKEKNRLLTENRIPIDYANVRYECDICGDTGMTKDGNVCRCYADVSRRAAHSQMERVSQ